MNKSLLMSLVAGTAALSLSAATDVQIKHVDRDVKQFETKLESKTARPTAKVTADNVSDDYYDAMYWGYTMSTAGAIGLSGGDPDAVMVAVGMPENYTKIYGGNKITSVYYPLGWADDDNVNHVARTATFWIKDALDGNPLYSQSVNFSGEPGSFHEFELTQPFEIPATGNVYIGFTFAGGNFCANSTPIVYSFTPTLNDDGCWIGYIQNGQQGWMSAGDQIGNLPIVAWLEGDKLPQNVLELWGINAPFLTSVGKSQTISAAVRNIGAAPITNFAVQAYTKGSEPTPAETLSFPQDSPMYATPELLTLTFSGMTATAAGDGEFYLCIPAVNGQENNLTTQTWATSEQMVLDEGVGYKRMSVFEDATGTWCGWCPAAYYDMEYMREEYADKGFIGIGVHATNSNSQVDPMDVVSTGTKTYAGITNYISGFPTVLLNREFSYSAGQGESMINQLIDNYDNSLSPITVSAELETDPTNSKRITVNTKTTAAIDFSDTRYKLSFVVTEDHVGPYMQTNYYSGGQNGDYGGFASKPDPTPLMYNDVARYCYGFDGVNSSLPAELKANEEYTYTTKVSLGTVSDLNRYAVTVMVIDQKSGVIANACRVLSPTYDGVEEITVEASDIVITGETGRINVVGTDNYEVYTIAGQRVNNSNLAAGVYIVRAADKVAKVMVR